MSAWPAGDLTLRKASEYEALIAPGTRVSEWLPAADGATNDYADLAAALTASYSTGLLELQPRKTYLIGTGLVVSSPVTIIGNGATIKKSTTLNDYAVKVTGANVEMVGLTVDGNRIAGNSTTSGCLRWDGTGGVARRVTAHNGRLVGLFVATGDLNAEDCVFSDIEGVTNTGDGVQVNAAGVFRGKNCRADNCRRTGFNFVAAAADGCELENCTANNNVFAAAMLQSDKGKVSGFKSSNNGTYGIYMQQATGWVLDGLEDEDAGQALHGEYTVNPSATSMEMLGCSDIHIGSAVSKRALGYGYAHGAISSVGCTYITYDDIYCEDAADPAVFIGGSSQRITVGNLTLKGSTVAVSFAEETVGDNNDYNTFHNITAIGCGYSLINGVKGSHNSFGHITAIDCFQRSPYISLVRWVDATATRYNTIMWLEVSHPSSVPSGATLPTNIMECRLGALHNWIAGGFTRSAITLLSEANAAGSNRVDFAAAP